MQTNKQLELAFDFIQYTGQNVFLTGKAGTGKTTFLKNLKLRSPKRMIVVAPTGVAAINAGGVTIHSFFQLNFGPQIGQPGEDSRQMRFSKEKINIIRSLDLLVIDEISMVRADVLDAIDRVMRRFRNRQKAFGGAQVLMIGDLQQLAPVVKRDEWELLRAEYNTVYFFSSKALRETSYVSIELTQVFRQQDDKFISILNKVRENLLDEAARTELNSRCNPHFKPTDEEGYITLCTHNAQAQRMNEQKLRSLSSGEKTFDARIEGNFPEYSFPTEASLRLKEGAQVMFVKNDPEAEKRFFNGKIGRITSFDEDTVRVQCPGEEDEIEVTPLLWENVKYTIDKDAAEIKEEVEGSFSQIPLKLAWAITIHKSQGLTFDKAIIDAEASFAHGQVYVALSRCRTLDGLVLRTPIAGRSIISDKTVNGFIQEVEANPPGEKELEVAKQAFQREQLGELFRFYREMYLVNQILKTIDENAGSFTQPVINGFREMKSLIQNELIEVAEKFQIQIDQYLKANPDVGKNEKLDERIKKAADYFETKVQAIIVDALDELDLEVDNRALRKQITGRADDLKAEALIKLAAYAVCKEGFSVKEIMEARAHVLIDTASVKRKASKAKEVLSSEHIPHPDLYNHLRAWRYEKSVAEGIPPYMIFAQRSLLELVHYLPVDKASLKLINGMGPKKIEQFGAEIIEEIRGYCEENHIDRGEIPLKENPKKEKKPKVDTKKVSLEMFQSGKTVAEIAKERAYTENTIEGHLAHFVKTGELDVFQFLTKEKLEKMLEYFKNTKERNLTPAREALGNEFSYGDLRIGLSYLESRKD
ncbi:helix-turn-helix domain-containing protein [Maribellus sp. CM-23]|uniref:helix-turn-helix domain-containing protein n=1 Tax=Maribellus sp. CM-23 TaxID=2781026 RepID=UPI00293F574F|nr:helix-turn-helix domain-containing protein [Maribellus sp. CM-23]MCE4566300.1 helix-turn-helix domain-containing protein [Maribellus sp. CM-23]